MNVCNRPDSFIDWFVSIRYLIEVWRIGESLRVTLFLLNEYSYQIALIGKLVSLFWVTTLLTAWGFYWQYGTFTVLVKEIDILNFISLMYVDEEFIMGEFLDVII